MNGNSLVGGAAGVGGAIAGGSACAIGAPGNVAGGLTALTHSQMLDIHSIVQGISAVKRHQTTISAELSELKRSNQLLWQDALMTREKHQKQEDTINRIVKFLAGVFGKHAGAAAAGGHHQPHHGGGSGQEVQRHGGGGVAGPGNHHHEGHQEDGGVVTRRRARLMIEDGRRQSQSQSQSGSSSSSFQTGGKSGVSVIEIAEEDGDDVMYDGTTNGVGGGPPSPMSTLKFLDSDGSYIEMEIETPKSDNSTLPPNTPVLGDSISDRGKTGTNGNAERDTSLTHASSSNSKNATTTTAAAKAINIEHSLTRTPPVTQPHPPSSCTDPNNTLINHNTDASSSASGNGPADISGFSFDPRGLHSMFNLTPSQIQQLLASLAAQTISDNPSSPASSLFSTHGLGASSGDPSEAGLLVDAGAGGSAREGGQGKEGENQLQQFDFSSYLVPSPQLSSLSLGPVSSGVPTAGPAAHGGVGTGDAKTDANSFDAGNGGAGGTSTSTTTTAGGGTGAGAGYGGDMSVGVRSQSPFLVGGVPFNAYAHGGHGYPSGANGGVTGEGGSYGQGFGGYGVPYPGGADNSQFAALFSPLQQIATSPSSGQGSTSGSGQLSVTPPNFLTQQWRATEDIDRDVNALNTSIHSLIQTFGLDPSLIETDGGGMMAGMGGGADGMANGTLSVDGDEMEEEEEGEESDGVQVTNAESVSMERQGQSLMTARSRDVSSKTASSTSPPPSDFDFESFFNTISTGGGTSSSASLGSAAIAPTFTTTKAGAGAGGKLPGTPGSTSTTVLGDDSSSSSLLGDVPSPTPSLSFQGSSHISQSHKPQSQSQLHVLPTTSTTSTTSPKSLLAVDEAVVPRPIGKKARVSLTGSTPTSMLDNVTMVMAGADGSTGGVGSGRKRRSTVVDTGGGGGGGAARAGGVEGASLMDGVQRVGTVQPQKLTVSKASVAPASAAAGSGGRGGKTKRKRG
ncbi:hypothetical protein AX17_002611 [Amanita inopinata Kibby_2008]|nr:hypothetical protein AX17_002611 [Amanita inopinata Kibby_2008]